VKLRRGALVTVVAGAAVLGLASPAIASSEPKLKVRLIEYKIQPARDFTAKGKTEIVAKDAGSMKHEFVVVRGDDPTTLPTKPDGSVDESKIPKSDKLGEIEDIKPGKTKAKVFKLPAGSYIFFCNIVEKHKDGTVVSHFKEGMYTTVEAS
jgi:uncharacterized cupredoxin-like copper-binding protein